MREVYLVNSENKSTVEDALRKDDFVGRQSIMVKLAASLGIKEDGYFIIINGSEEAIKLAEKIIGSLAKKYEKKGEVLKKIDEEEDSAIEGFGNILGD